MLLSYRDKTPRLGERCFIADNAAVVGEVVVGDDCSVWFGAAVRADFEAITIGDRTNIQDNVTVHNDFGKPVHIGSDVSIGHNAVVHSCTVEDGALIGMGAVVLDNAVVGAGSIVAAGAVVTKGTVIPPHSLVMGVPAKVVRELEPGVNQPNADHYVIRKDHYLEAAKEARA